MEEDNKKYIYSRPVLDFVTVCVEFCKQLEQCHSMERSEFIRIMRGLLPMLYLKISMLKQNTEDSDGYWNEETVTEEDYNYVRSGISSVMGDKDDYLDVFVKDFKYSDRPVLRTISEDLADLYQALRNFIEPYRSECEEATEVALQEITETFRSAWGQTALNALRALHDAEFGGMEN